MLQSDTFFDVPKNVTFFLLFFLRFINILGEKFILKCIKNRSTKCSGTTPLGLSKYMEMFRDFRKVQAGPRAPSWPNLLRHGGFDTARSLFATYLGTDVFDMMFKQKVLELAALVKLKISPVL
jgi:hypothetical protein